MFYDTNISVFRIAIKIENKLPTCGSMDRIFNILEMFLSYLMLENINKNSLFLMLTKKLSR